ncbi:MAG: hypothetical protein AB7N69_12205 [Immundisolibacter sp.]|uniref:hypothetical protein n=1 Tax=Immundisolibacter sp. TaxID=1934948 RepID=UPI003D1212D6
MTRPVAFTAAAQAELIEGAAWYDAKRPGLGDDFVAQIEHCVRHIAEQPHATWSSTMTFAGSWRRAFLIASTFSWRIAGSSFWLSSTAAGILPSGSGVAADSTI